MRSNESDEGASDGDEDDLLADGEGVPEDDMESQE